MIAGSQVMSCYAALVTRAYVSRESHEGHGNHGRDQDANALAVVDIDRKEPVEERWVERVGFVNVNGPLNSRWLNEDTGG